MIKLTFNSFVVITGLKQQNQFITWILKMIQITWILKMIQMQDLVRENGCTFCKYEFIDLFQVIMSEISFVCVIDVTLTIGYSKYEAKRMRQQGVGKVYRATIAKK